MKLFFVLVLLCSAYGATAQLQGQPLIDSIEKVLPGMKEDSNKVKAYNKISQVYYGINLLKTFAPAEQGLALAEKIGWKRGIANMHNNLGLFVSDTGNIELGNEHFKKSYAINKEIDSKPNEINNLNNIGRNFMAMSDFSNAADYFYQALSVAKELKSDDHIALVGTNLISCFFRQKNYAKATEYANLTIEHARIANNSRHLINGLMQLGATRLELKDTIGAKTYLQEALKVCEETGNMADKAKVLLNLVVTEYPDYETALVTALQTDTLVQQTAPGSATDMSINYTLAEVYHKLALQNSGVAKSNYQKNAWLRLVKAREMAEGNVPEMMVSILLLQGDMEDEAGNYEASLHSFKRSTAMSDSLFSQDKKNEIAGLEGKHNIAIKDQEIALNKLVVASQQKTQWALIAGLGLLAVIGVMLFRQSRARQKTNAALTVLNTQLDEANKLKSRFFGILSHDLRSPIVNLVHFLELQKNDPDLLTEEDKQEHHQEISEAAENLLNTMESMLLWSKEQMQNFKPNIKQIAVADLFDYLERLFVIPDNINLEFITAPQLTLTGDENYLRTIMQNLTSNAVQALKKTNDGRIVWKAEKDNNGTRLSISDNGPGISADKARVLFDEKTVTNEKTGFGLHLVRDLAKSVKYNIVVESEEGKGTTFILSNEGN
jgi:signal transduction histidine kinase